jgi:hypothetical protein
MEVSAAAAKGGHYEGGIAGPGKQHKRTSGKEKPPLERSHAVVDEFQRQNPCPSTGGTSGACPGWVKDHVKPLACGGGDAVWNLQWQTEAAAKAKDKTERKYC